MFTRKAASKEFQSSWGRVEKPILAVCVSISIWIFFVAYRSLYINFVEETGIFETLTQLFSSVVDILLWVLLLFILLSISFIYMRKSQLINVFLYKWRWVIAGLILVLLVLFEVSGSSLAMWGLTLPNGTTDGLIMGHPRPFRTDEWATTLPMTFAQFNDESAYLPYWGEVFRATSTDMFIVSGQPVIDAAILFRPFSWGYLVLGMAKGLSFSWSCRLICLFMLAFELGIVLLNKSKPLSLAFALLIAFSPVISWWGSSEVLIYGIAVLLLFIRFFKAGKRWQKTLLALSFFTLLGAYALTCYPAWQVPIALIVFVMGIIQVVKIKKDVHFSARRDLMCIIPGLLIFVVGMVYVWSIASEAMHMISSTAYPGQRVVFGGNVFDYYFNYPLTLFTPLVSAGLGTDHVDVLSMYFDFFPLGLIFGAYLLFVQKKKDPMLIALLVLAVFFLVYCTVGFPEWLAKITLMSLSIPERAVVIASLINLILLFYVLSLFPKPKQRGMAICFAAVYALAVVFITWCFKPGYMSVTKIVVLSLLLFVAALVFLIKKTPWVLAGSLAVALFSGALVNPLQLGISPVQDNELIQEIRAIKSTSDKKWISATGWAENITALGGASTINTTQVYPNFELWKILDPDGSEENTYNRFAHLEFHIEDIPEATITLQPQDVVVVEVPVQQLQQLNVGYILSWDKLESLNSNEYGVEFNLISQYPGYYLYEAEYSQ